MNSVAAVIVVMAYALSFGVNHSFFHDWQKSANHLSDEEYNTDCSAARVA